MFRRRRKQNDFNAEIEAHLQLETEQLKEQGLSEEEARMAARRAFGNVIQAQERFYDSGRWVGWDRLARDLRFGLRMLWKNPGFTAVAVLTFALGIGANTAMFSIVNRILLRPLPYAEPERLIQLWENPHGDVTSRNTVAGGVVKGWQDQSTTLEGIAAIRTFSANLTRAERPVRLSGLQVSSNYLRLLRLNPLYGRDFHVEEGQAGRSDVVILSHAAWQNYFGGSIQLIGGTIQLGNRPTTVIGILSPAARLTHEVDFLLPFAYGTPGWNRAFAGHWLQVIGRLQPTATIAQVRGEMAVITERQRGDYPAFKKNWGVTVVPLHEQVTGEVRPQLLLLFGATACVLLIACANVAGLLLARGISRGKEMALRLALGASRWSVSRQLLTENLLLAATGGVIGMLLALWSVDVFEHGRPPAFAPGLPISLDERALAFAVAVSLVTGLAAGLVPAWRLALTHFDELKSGCRSSQAGAHAGVRGTLIVGQIALSLILLIGAGLLLRSLMRLQSVPLGFEPSGVLIADLTLDPNAFRDAGKRVRYLDELFRRVELLPGVESAGIAPYLPLQGSYTERVMAEGSTNPEPLTCINFVTGDYMETMQIPVLAGRLFTESDNRPNAPRTMLINAHLAAQLFAAENPIGRRVRLLGQSYEVVGLTGDVLVWGVERGVLPLVYLPEAFSGGFNSSLVVRTKLPPLSLAKSVQAAILAVAPDQPVSNLRTYDYVMAQMAFARRLMLGLLSLFAAIALTLAAVGLYGIIAFSVDRRTHELGIRRALGASRKHIVALVISGGLKLTAAGIAVGLVGGCLLTRFIASYLFGVTATDPLTLVGTTLLLVTTALLACWLPARRATKVDPMEALRME
jgi:putative ABC transport system permease protein